MLIVPCTYDYIGSFVEGIAKVEINDKTGFINEKGVLLTPCSFDYTFYIGIDDDGISMANQNDKWGFVNKK